MPIIQTLDRRASGVILMGKMAKAYYNLAVSQLGTVFSLIDAYPVLNKMTAVYQTFAEGRPIRERCCPNKTDIWTALLLMDLKKRRRGRSEEPLRGRGFYGNGKCNYLYQ